MHVCVFAHTGGRAITSRQSIALMVIFYMNTCYQYYCNEPCAMFGESLHNEYVMRGIHTLNFLLKFHFIMIFHIVRVTQLSISS